MAPRKRKADVAAEGGGDVKEAVVAVEEVKKENGVGRVTRSSTRMVNKESVVESVVDVKEKKLKKAKAAVKEKVVKKGKEVEKKEEEKEEVGDEKAAVKEKVVKKGKEVEKKEEEKEEVGDGDGDVKGAKTIVIEHCKQCNAFKTRAILVKEGLEKAIDGIQVLVNPEKPRRGCFEIREEGGKIFISLLEMKRPFPPLKALDMEKVISDIIEKVK